MRRTRETDRTISVETNQVRDEKKQFIVCERRERHLHPSKRMTKTESSVKGDRVKHSKPRTHQQDTTLNISKPKKIDE